MHPDEALNPSQVIRLNLAVAMVQSGRYAPDELLEHLKTLTDYVAGDEQQSKRESVTLRSGAATISAQR